MLKTNKSLETNLIIDKIENDSSNDWDELCKKCSSLMSEANLSHSDIDRIVEEAKSKLID